MKYVLVPGSGGVAFTWSPVAALLRAAGDETIVVELPGEDERAGFPEYADLVVSAAGGDEVVLAAASLGGFTAAMAAPRMRLRALVLVNAMIPLPGETPLAWREATGSQAAREAAADAGGYPREMDMDTYFWHDLAPALAEEAKRHDRNETKTTQAQPCAFLAWPAVPIHVLAGAGDRLFPPEFQRRIARERLGIDVDVRPGGHMMTLSNPDDVAAYLIDASRAGAG
ncbi:MAG: hypothetical protein JWP97_6445 [Labilithrix sp.]|nr:hypothetical protein [Labilithrix sp.]